MVLPSKKICFNKPRKINYVQKRGISENESPMPSSFQFGMTGTLALYWSSFQRQ